MDVILGRCHISFESDNIVGEFNLTEELDNSEYVLYMISKPNILNEIYLEGIMLVDHYDGSKAIKAESMQVI